MEYGRVLKLFKTKEDKRQRNWGRKEKRKGIK